MRGALAMHEDAQIGIFTKQGSRCAGMVEVNVREQNGLKIRDREPPRQQLPAQRLQSGCWAGIENRIAIAGFKKNSADRPRTPHPVEIEYRRGIHILGMVREHRGWNKLRILADALVVCCIQLFDGESILTA